MYRKYNTITTAINSLKVDNSLLLGAKTAKWGILFSTQGAMYVLYRIYHMRIQFAPLYVLIIKPIQAHFLVDAEKYSITYNKDNLPRKTSDKLKYFRYQKGLLQKEVADYTSMDRGSYSSYEHTHRDYYEKDKMLKIAEVLEVDVGDLVDEYNLFLYNEPHLKVRDFRKSQGLTQSEFASKHGMTVYAVKGIEQGKQMMFKSTWEKIFRAV